MAHPPPAQAKVVSTTAFINSSVCNAFMIIDRARLDWHTRGLRHGCGVSDQPQILKPRLSAAASICFWSANQDEE
jgi:hypothetical protein